MFVLELQEVKSPLIFECSGSNLHRYFLGLSFYVKGSQSLKLEFLENKISIHTFGRVGEQISTFLSLFMVH